MNKLADLKVFTTGESKAIFNVRQFRKTSVIKFVVTGMNLRNKVYHQQKDAFLKIELKRDNR